MRQRGLRSAHGRSSLFLPQPGRTQNRLRRHFPRRPSRLSREKPRPHRHDRPLPHLETRYPRIDSLFSPATFPRHRRLRRHQSSRSEFRRSRTRRILLPRPSRQRRPLRRKRRIPHFRFRWPHFSISHPHSNGRSSQPRWFCILRSIAATGGSNKMTTELSQKENLLYRTLLGLALIVLAAALRVAPHPWNFTPVGAMALFSGALLKDRRLAFFFPLLALFLRYIFTSFHNLIPILYASFLINVAIGLWL